MFNSIIVMLTLIACGEEPKTEDTGSIEEPSGEPSEPSAENTDEDEDGITADLDCDDTDADIGLPGTYYQDSDGDGFGDADVSEEV